jgi:integrase
VNGLTLEDLTDQVKGDRDGLEKRLMGFVGQQERDGYAPGSIENYLKSVRSWANWHGVELVRKIKISNRTSTPTLDSEEVPTVQQVLDIRSAATPRGRICVGAVAYGGLRPESLGHQRIKDGIKLGDLPELDVEEMKFTKVPALMIVRPEVSKAGHKYRTFLPKETCRDILAYLEKRIEMNEQLAGDSPLVAVELSNKNKGWRMAQNPENLHIVTAVVSRDIRSAMRPTYSYRPYVLRSFFSTRLLMAVSDGVLDNNYRIYWMGHAGQMSAKYSSNKAMLPDDLI